MDAQTLDDLFSAFGPVKARRLFGGMGIYADGLMFALVMHGVIYLKADDELAAALEARGATPFSYGTKSGARTITSFWSVPDSALDEADDLAALARRALDVARASAEVKAGKNRGHRPPASPSGKRSKPPRG